jgi:hypothetical protein
MEQGVGAKIKFAFTLDLQWRWKCREQVRLPRSPPMTVSILVHSESFLVMSSRDQIQQVFSKIQLQSPLP